MPLRPSPMLASLLFVLPLASVATALGDEQFRPLFDGKSLKGWEGNERIFRVANGAIVAGSKNKRIARNEFLCTRERFADFELRLKAKLVGDGRNAGIQFRSERIPNHHEVKGYQCDMGQMGKRNIWGSLYDESRRRRFLTEGKPELVEKAFKTGDWNEFTIRCQGRHIQIFLNGKQTVDYIEKEDVPPTGRIGLQIHSGPAAEAWYKEIRIRKLPASDDN